MFSFFQWQGKDVFFGALRIDANTHVSIQNQRRYYPDAWYIFLLHDVLIFLHLDRLWRKIKEDKKN